LGHATGTTRAAIAAAKPRAPSNQLAIASANDELFVPGEKSHYLLNDAFPLGGVLSQSGSNKQAYHVEGHPNLVALVQREFVKRADGTLGINRANHPERIYLFEQELHSLERAASWGLPVINVIAEGEYLLPTSTGDLELRRAIVTEKFDILNKDLFLENGDYSMTPECLSSLVPQLMDAQTTQTLSLLDELLREGKVICDLQLLFRSVGSPKCVLTDIAFAIDTRQEPLPAGYDWVKIENDQIERIRRVMSDFGAP
jgi:hypothetical protein